MFFSKPKADIEATDIQVAKAYDTIFFINVIPVNNTEWIGGTR
jgi:hypothetical protein